VADRGWSRSFDDPIPLPNGRELVTLKDAADYITKLPKVEHSAPEWQTAMEALMLVAERGGDTMLARIGITMLARIGIMKALHRHDRPKPPAPRRKSARAYRIVR
jgi:hypothetical protein